MYYVSRKDLGDFPILVPKIPRRMDDSECHFTPRVCFAPSIEQCLISLVGHALEKNVTYYDVFLELTAAQPHVTLYWTDEDLYRPNPVSDYHITQEHWSLKSILVRRIGYIDLSALVISNQISVIDQPTSIRIEDLVRMINHLTDDGRSKILYSHVV